MAADVSVVLPARNEGARVAQSIRAIARARTAQTRVEFVVVDDASTDGSAAELLSEVPKLLDEPRIDIRMCRLDEHSGTYRARNAGAELASSDVLFMTDAHVRFSKGWDEVIFENLQPERILSGVTVDDLARTRGYGCRLEVPFMGAVWNGEPREAVAPVQIAPCHATVIPHALFDCMGGYDEGMLYYGGGEPEFSVRAWLLGAQIAVVKALEVSHHFRTSEELDRFLDEVRPYSVHNRIRFGLLYLSETGREELLDYYQQEYPELIDDALNAFDEPALWERRAALEEGCQYSFDWFVRHFDVRTENGEYLY